MIKGVLKYLHIMNVMLVALALVGCENRDGVVGQWQFSPWAEVVGDSIASDVTGCLVISGDGRVLLTADVDLTSPMPDALNVYADSVTVKAVASIEGIWHYASRKHDAIDIVYDRSSFGVSIDPDDVIYMPESGSRRLSVVHDVMKDTIIEEYRQMLSPGLETFFNEFGHLDGIRFSNGVMYCESTGHAYMMHAI